MRSGEVRGENESLSPYALGAMRIGCHAHWVPCALGDMRISQAVTP